MKPSGQFPEETTAGGEFARREDAFREWVTDDGTTSYAAEPDRYHLYVSLACPWAHRTVIARQLKGLENAVGLTVADPVRDERGWAFRDGDGFSRDPVNGFNFLSEAYRATKLDYRGRYTVPVLWDKRSGRIVNNSEDDICRMFDGVLASLGRSGPSWFPAEIEAEHRRWADDIYEHVNNGVYRAGFATRQEIYEKACRDVFAGLDRCEARLTARRFLFGARPVEVDWRLFCTLVRFDAVYHGHFKCNLRRVADYPALAGYLRDLFQQPGIEATVNLGHIKRHYYCTHEDINPTRIVPLGPLFDFRAPSGRAHLAG
ncbi:MAG TPA: glutathione S-transferase C-terminal domain-containing protein [Lacunisphaera sp.]|nr:glutathione S-transferase C-terminal domain-containing protein [Lacunisphaera sp.]